MTVRLFRVRHAAKGAIDQPMGQYRYPVQLLSLFLAIVPVAKAESVSCLIFGSGVATGNPAPPELVEISGMAASRVNTGVLWVHNDSNNAFRLYALTPAGDSRGYLTSSKITRGDWEDLAIGPGPEPGTPYIYLADTGDNDQVGKAKRLYRFPEPVLPVDDASFVLEIPEVEAFVLKFPDDMPGPYDCEALMVDPLDGSLYFITKDTNLRNNGKSEIFRTDGSRESGSKLALTHEGTLDLNPGVMNLVTAADMAPDGSGILVRTYLQILYWPRIAGVSVADTLAQAPCTAPQIMEPQGEAIAFGADSEGYFTASEKRSGTEIPPIHYFPRLTDLAESE